MILRLAQIAFLILVFSLGLMQPFIFFFGQRASFTDFIFPFVFLFWILALIFRQTNFRRSRLYLPLAIYFLAFVCSTIFSSDPKHSFPKLLGVSYLIALSVLSFNLIDTTEKLKKVFQVWLFATAIVGLTSLLSFALFYLDRSNPLLFYTLSHYGTLPPGNYPRIQSTFQDPNMLCNYLSVGLMILLVSIRFKWINHRLSLILLVLYSFACAFTISPGLGGIFLSVGLWLWLIFQEKKKFILARLSLIGGILFAIFFFLAILATPIQTETSPFYFRILLIEKRLDPSSRLLAWETSLQTWREYPFFGKGVGTNVAYVRYLNPSGRAEILLDAHQMWLNVAGQTGTFGFLALCYFCVFMFRRADSFSFADEKRTLQTALGIAFISAFLYQGLSVSFEDSRHLWILTGLLISLSEGDFPKTLKND